MIGVFILNNFWDIIGWYFGLSRACIITAWFVVGKTRRRPIWQLLKRLV